MRQSGLPSPDTSPRSEQPADRISLPGYPVFRRTVLHLTGIDLDGYKSNQMERRLATIMKRHGVQTLFEYARLLAADEAKLRAFKDFVTINVSEFFRNPELFGMLERAVLPGLVRPGRELRIWSAGCSYGAEPYSLAIILADLCPAAHPYILASDIDEQVLRTAEAGLYSDRDVKNVSPERLRKYFDVDGTNCRVRDFIRARVSFRRHNLLADPFEDGFDLIVCRNVVIYFTEETKQSLYRKFHASLKPGGVLFVGGTESLLRPRELGFEQVFPFFYRRV